MLHATTGFGISVPGIEPPRHSNAVPHGAKGRRACGGFTLVELIVVIVLLGILSIYATSRFADSNAFALRAAEDQLVSAARYAQEIAMVRRATTDNPVQLEIGTSGYRITVDGTAITLPGSGGTTADLPDGIAASGATVGFNDSLGNISGGAVTVTLSADDQARDICIETSGYAHAC